MLPYEEASYLAQVRRARHLALDAVRQYPLTIAKLVFIQHGENTTFCGRLLGGGKVLVRVHRLGYHNAAALREELAWLAMLAKTCDVGAPIPIKSKNGRLTVSATARGVREPRYCSVLKWVEGRFLSECPKVEHLRLLGQYIGRLHRRSRSRKVRHRRYWDASGLMGAKATMGSGDFGKLTMAQRRTISQARYSLIRQLNLYEHRFPERMGLIHADLHFGNFLLSAGEVVAIDFDDCGYGFHAYDLAVPLTALACAGGSQTDQHEPSFETYESALHAGYSEEMPWDAPDMKLTRALMTARNICMLGWLVSRSDNPRLASQVPAAVEALVRELKSR